MKKLIIIPTYNEIENVEKMVHKVMSLEGNYDLLIVEDNSPDGTAAKVKELMLQYPEKLHHQIPALLQTFHHHIQNHHFPVLLFPTELQ